VKKKVSIAAGLMAFAVGTAHSQGGDADPQQFIPMLIQQWQQGRFPFERMIKRYPFDSTDQAFADCASGVALKPMLDIGA
jgi:Zn-dependent alcohol dehydrogenase